MQDVFYFKKTLAFALLCGCLGYIDLGHAMEEPDKGVHEKVLYFHNINYILPYYRSSNLNKNAAPQGITDPIKNQEFKGQFSFRIPLWRAIINNNSHLYIAYTQQSYWQLYVSSPYFRDTNYNPEVFYSYKPTSSWLLKAGMDHQSNGRGNILERSWNRVYVEAGYQFKWFSFKLKSWHPVFKSSSIDTHNPDILHFLGHSKATLAASYKDLTGFLEVQNIESGLKRGSQTLHINYKVKEYLYLYGQVFNGYGQSLIDYNRRSTAFGVGVSLNAGIFD